MSVAVAAPPPNGEREMLREKLKNFAKYDGRKRGLDGQAEEVEQTKTKRHRGFGGGGGGNPGEPVNMANVLLNARFNVWNLPSNARVLLVSNVPAALAKPNALFNLFGFYGNVARVKILRRQLKTALIEFDTASFAAIARDNLDNFSIDPDHKLVVSFSRFTRVRTAQVPPDADSSPDAAGGLAQDFTLTPELQRRRRYATWEQLLANRRRITPPSPVIHVGASPTMSTSLQVLTSHLESSGLAVKASFATESKVACEKRRGGGRLAYLEMSGGAGPAALALALVHGLTLSTEEVLRVSFTGSNTLEEEKAKVMENKNLVVIE